MKPKHNTLVPALVALAFLLLQPFTSHAQGTAFTYQGRLDTGGNPATGIYDLRFTIHETPSGGAALGGPITNAATVMDSGLFTATLDFGAGVFTGAERWLEIGVRTNGGGAFATLSPRQALTSTPYAIRSANAASAVSLSGTVAASQLVGTISSNQIAAGSISTVMLADGAVTTANIADGAVNVAKLQTQLFAPLATTFTNPTPAFEDFFGRALAAVGTDRVLIGAYGDNTGAFAAGAAYLFSTNGTLLTTFTNPTPAFQDWFGAAVAAVGTDRVLIGAAWDNTGATAAGAAYLFSTNGTLLTTFTNPTPEVNDSFGYAVAAVGPDRVLIGAWGDNTGATSAGAAYLFSTNGTLLTTFTNPTPEVNDFFGATVAAVGPNRVLIGASGDDTGASSAGAAYLFSTDGTLLTTFTNPTPEDEDFFGVAVAAVGAGGVLIGAYRDDTGASSAGAAYLFQLDAPYIPGLFSERVVNGGITSAQIAPGAVGTAQLAPGSTFNGTVIGNGSGLTNLNASQITSGTLADARLTANVALLSGSQTVTGAKTFSNTGSTFTGNGAGLTSLNASQITSGNLGPARLPAGGTWTLSSALNLAANTLVIDPSNQRVGIGIAVPAHDLHIRGRTALGSVMVTPNAAENSSQLVLSENLSGTFASIIRHDGGPNQLQFFGVNNGTDIGPHLVIQRDSGNVGIGTNNPAQKLVVVGNIFATGTITPNSDRNLKTDITAVDTLEILEGVTRLPIQQWRFQSEDSEVKHVGPMAQDFQEVFGLGANPTAIATVDADGVALAAIQGLNEKVEMGRQKAESRIGKLESENTELKARLEKLEQLLAPKLSGGAK
jgi:hypothetical protein